MSQDATLPSPGDVIAGKYRVERLIGRGGMGAVFAAQHLILNQRVALKLLLGELADSQEASARFVNEARAAAQIQGEHVARVLDIGQLPTGVPFMVLEYLEGSDLAGILQQRGPLPVSEVADYALQALDALAQAHSAGIVHRDLKPANLFLTSRHDGTSLVKVLDFGISKNTTAPSGMTSTRAVMGSPEYMSPEQLRTPRGVDARTDIWSLGVILYELLAGRVPFQAETLADLFMQICQVDPPSIRTLRPDVPPAFEAVVMRCMAREPSARFQSVRELSTALLVFASDQARAMAIARGSKPGLAAATLHQEPVPASTTPNTAAPWAGTMGKSEGAGRSRVVQIVAVSVLGLLVVITGVTLVARMVTKHPDAPTSEAPAANAASATAAPTAAPPAASSVAVAVSPPPTATTPKSPAAATPPKAAPPTLKPSASAAVTPPPSPPAPAPAQPASKCSPNYYFDKDGNKHFKPECF